MKSVNWKFVESMLRRVERSSRVTAPPGEGIGVPIRQLNQ